MKIGLTRSLVCLVWFDRCLISCLLSTELRQGTGDLSFHVGKDLHISWDGDSPFHPRCGKKLSLIRNGIPSTMPLFRPEGRSLEEVEIVWVVRFYLTVSSYSAQKMIRCRDDRLPRSFWSSVGHKLFGSNTHFGGNKLSQWDALLVPSKERRRKDMCRHWFGWTERMSMIGEEPFLSSFLTRSR